MDEKYYFKLVTSEYKSSKNLNATLKALIGKMLDMDDTLGRMIDAFDLDKAVGVQLDALGRIVGVGRVLTFQPTSASPVLNDDIYRLVIKCKIVKNHWDGSLKNLYDAWDDIFPDAKLQVQDLQDMSFNIVIRGNFSEIVKELIQHGYIVPKPEGVRINTLTILEPDALPIFAYDKNDKEFSGYTSQWAREGINYGRK